MHVFQLSYAILSMLVVQAAALAINAEDIQVRQDLSDVEQITNTTLERRADVKGCWTASSKFKGCSPPADYGVFEAAMAGIIYERSKNKDCTTAEGTLEGIKYRYFGSRNGHQSGSCDTTASEAQLTSAITELLKELGQNVCGAVCTKLTHGGTWEGYLMIASPYDTISVHHCNAASKIGDGHCFSV